jgi:cell division protein DivIC
MERIKDIINLLPRPLRNKYFILLLLFIFWIVFLDNYNLINQMKMGDDVDNLKKQKEFYLSEIKSDSTELSKLKNDSEAQEKFAREKFLMRKDNEDVFIIREDEDK